MGEATHGLRLARLLAPLRLLPRVGVVVVTVGIGVHHVLIALVEDVLVVGPVGGLGHVVLRASGSIGVLVDADDGGRARDGHGPRDRSVQLKYKSIYA